MNQEFDERSFSEAKAASMERIAKLLVQEDPFPHYTATDVFSDAMYAAMLEHLPSTQSYKRWTEVGKVKLPQYERRLQFYLTPSWLDLLQPAPIKEFWTRFADWIHGDEFRRAALRPFDPYVHERFPDQDEWPVTYAETLVLRHEAEYFIGPHTDMPSRVMNILFYLAEDDESPGLGTTIYAPKDPGFRCPGTRHHDFSGFTPVKTFEYRPNTLMGFLKTDRSFHGVEPISEEDAKRTARNVIQYMLYDNPSCAPKKPEYFVR